MKRIEKLAIALIVIVALQVPATWCFMHYLPDLVKADGQGVLNIEGTLGVVLGAWSFLVSVVCAIWLYSEASRQSSSKWVWCLFGLVFKLPAVAIFYGVTILNKLIKIEKANQPFDATR